MTLIYSELRQTQPLYIDSATFAERHRLSKFFSLEKHHHGRELLTLEYTASPVQTSFTEANFLSPEGAPHRQSSGSYILGVVFKNFMDRTPRSNQARMLRWSHAITLTPYLYFKLLY